MCISQNQAYSPHCAAPAFTTGKHKAQNEHMLAILPSKAPSAAQCPVLHMDWFLTESFLVAVPFTQVPRPNISSIFDTCHLG